MTLVRIISANLNFGCMLGIVEGTGAQVTLSLFTHRHQRLMSSLPRVGDVCVCDHVCHSVYEPRVLLRHEDLEMQRMLRRCGMPHDVATEYFPIRRPLQRIII